LNTPDKSEEMGPIISNLGYSRREPGLFTA
jgi:hypothetical protein